MLCIPQEADHITELRACCLLGWSDDSPSEEEDDEQMQEEDGEPEGDEPEGDEHEETSEEEEADPESSPGSDQTEWGKTKKRLKHGGDDAICRSAGPLWMKRNPLLLMAHGPTRTPLLVATLLHV